MNSQTINKDGAYNLKAAEELFIADNIKTTIVIEEHSDSIKVDLGRGSDVLLINFACQKVQDVTLNNDSRCVVINILNDNSEQQYNIHESADLTLKNISSVKNNNLTVSSSINHLEKNSRSLMISKGVLDHSNTIIKGMINISKDSSGSQGYQKTEMLLLDDASRAISIPELNINNHDVRCTHGASISNIDDNKLFYLQSRGLNIEDSKNMIIKGFFLSMLKDLDDGMAEKIMDRLK